MQLTRSEKLRIYLGATLNFAVPTAALLGTRALDLAPVFQITISLAFLLVTGFFTIRWLPRIPTEQQSSGVTPAPGYNLLSTRQRDQVRTDLVRALEEAWPSEEPAPTETPTQRAATR